MQTHLAEYDGTEAALTMLDRIRPDRILSGVHRGAMSGVELCAHLGTHLEFQLIPFMLPTSASELDARVAGLTA